MSKRQELREKRRKEQTRNRIISIILIVVGAVAVVGFFIAPSLKPVGEVVTITPRPRPQADFNAMGDPNAPVKIEEYSDYQCPFCEHFWTDTEQQLVETYVKTGKVYFVYHTFGEFIGRESARAAEAAYCAGDQGKFWDYHDMLFANQQGENEGAFADRRLVAFGQALGLDMNTFNACFNGGKYASKVQQDGTDATQAGVNSTPSFVINGELAIQGAQPFSTFQAEIEKRLQGAQ